MGTIDLSILICTLEERRQSFQQLFDKLKEQAAGLPVEVLYERDNREISIGKKRNLLVSRSKGKYLCFVDDDDDVSYDYVELILDNLGKDCVGIKGVLLQKSRQPRIFIHSIQYESYIDGMMYFRPPNHLNPVLSEIAKTVKFPLNNFGEDTSYAMQLVGKLKTENMIEQEIYYYQYDEKYKK